MNITAFTEEFVLDKKERKVPEVVIRRMPRYYRYLKELSKNGQQRISSGALAKKMGVTASQIRQDFSYFGGFGQQGYGYNIDFVTEEIENLFGVVSEFKAIIVGAGNMGHALANYQGIINRKVKILAMFDVNKSIIGTKISDIPVMDIKDMQNFVEEKGIEIAMLTLPKENVKAAVDILKASGIKGFWNFTSMELGMNDDISVENVHLTDSLMTLCYKINNHNDKN